MSRSWSVVGGRIFGADMENRKNTARDGFLLSIAHSFRGKKTIWPRAARGGVYSFNRRRREYFVHSCSLTNTRSNKWRVPLRSIGRRATRTYLACGSTSENTHRIGSKKGKGRRREAARRARDYTDPPTDRLVA